ncbi:MAG TPA: flagellar basal-body rod protein FlgF [Polyangiaceae bacterium]|jgi:flagellar basal-body rod protein FlgF|nr:flagellar basal-body rod protein FlgF [Polyangiaceae bacterium]
MSSGIWMAASGASAQMTALESTANNLANANTNGYKAEQAVFKEHLIRALYTGHAQSQMRYTGIDEVAPDLQSGPIQVTGRPLDAAVDGDGYFGVQTPQGPRYTRAGAFEVGPGGTLVTAQGYPVIGSDGSTIQVPSDKGKVAIGDDGMVRVLSTVPGQPDTDLGQISVVTFANPKGLEKQGDNLFRATKAAGAPQSGDVHVKSGALEMPNISVVKGMTDLVSATRSFEALQQAVNAYSDLERHAASDIVRAR